MVGDDEPKTPPEDAGRTVFLPSGPSGPSADDPAATPSGASGPAPPAWSPPPQPSSDLPPPPPQSSQPAPSMGAASLGAGGGRIAVGMVLNHIYEVRRFIARGGMGEVYEGVNVNTDERVAIKVILSHLALDENVLSMFRKEARTLTRLSHPALVQYRVLAQEPTLGVFYIVTEFIDGAQLGDVIGQVRPDADALEGLIRRLASGLAAAHELGAIHRDMAPDNVLLPGGRLDRATIIDFGIAKDLDPSNKTIVGDGFAGKMGFVAPEQFGDFGREVGPWTDVYSLALVILAVAAGKPVDMGATLVDAIDKRRAGPDLSPAPERLRPVLAGMLKPNPAERFRSMAEVLQALDRSSQGLPPAGSPPRPPPGPPASLRAAQPPTPAKGPPWAWIGAGVALVVLIGLAAVLFANRPAPGKPASAVAADSGVRGSERVRQAVEAALPGVSCSWIDIDDVNDSSGAVALRLSGVAGSPVEAQKAISAAAQSVGAHIGLVDTSNVFPVGAKTCQVLDAFRAFREPSSEHGRRFVSQQSNWELMKTNPPCQGPNAKAVVNIRIGDPSKDFSIIGMDRNGGLQQIFASRQAFMDFHNQVPDFSTATGDDSFSSTSCYNESGLVGELLVTGAGPFDLGLPDAIKTSDSRPVDAAWLQTFANTAKAKGWRTSMVWYRVVNDQPG